MYIQSAGHCTCSTLLLLLIDLGIFVYLSFLAIKLIDLRLESSSNNISIIKAAFYIQLNFRSNVTLELNMKQANSEN